MLVFIYGNDSYRVREYLIKILRDYQAKHAESINVTRYSFQDEESPKSVVAKLEGSLNNLGLFAEKKIVTLGHTLSLNQSGAVLELLSKYDLSTDKEVLLLLYEYLDENSLIKKNKELFGILKNVAHPIKEFGIMEGKKLEDWIANRFKELDSSIEPPAIRKLVERLSLSSSREKEPDISWLLSQEISKLVSFTRQRKINTKDVDLLVHKDDEPQIFALTNALAEKNRVQAFSLLHQSLERGMEPSHIFSMIIGQARNMLLVKDMSQRSVPAEEIARKTNLHPYAVRKTMEYIHEPSLDELKKRLIRLAEIERLFKSGQSNLSDELFGLVFSP